MTTTPDALAAAVWKGLTLADARYWELAKYSLKGVSHPNVPSEDAREAFAALLANWQRERGELERDNALMARDLASVNQAYAVMFEENERLRKLCKDAAKMLNKDMYISGKGGKKTPKGDLVARLIEASNPPSSP